MLQYRTPRSQYTLLQPKNDEKAAYATPRRRTASRWAFFGCLLLAIALLIYGMQGQTDIQTIIMDISTSMTKIGLISFNASRSQCQIKHTSITDVEYVDTLGDVRAQWLAEACQEFFHCNGQLLLTHRTCTAEDSLSDSIQLKPHVTKLLVSERFRTVYVVNPTTVDYLVQHIMTNTFHAREQSSLQISQQMIDQFFFFSFIDDPQARFFYAAEAVLREKWDANTSCADRVRLMQPLALLHPPHSHSVHSQAYTLSADAGVSNNMLKLNWLHHARTFPTSIVSLIRHIQHWNRECVPEIDFLELNFQLIARHREAKERAQALRTCSIGYFDTLLNAAYTQDSACFA